MDEEIKYLLATLHLPGFGDVSVRVKSAYGSTLDSIVQSATTHTDGWISVERNDGDSWNGEKWTPMQVNLSHFAMVTQTGVYESQGSGS